MNNINMFTDKKDLEKLKQALNEIHGTKIEKIMNYGDDETAFSNYINELLQYIHELKTDGHFHTIYLHRIHAGVKYGEIGQNGKTHKGTIQLNNMDGFKIIYDTIQDEFKEEFDMGLKYTEDKGWIPLSTISNNLILDIDSTEEYDYDWFSEYADKLENNNQKVK